MIKKLSRAILALMLATLSLPAVAEFNADEQRMLNWIDAHAEDANSLLEETVNIGSGTMNHKGVREVGAVMRRELDALGLETEWIEMPPEVNRAGHLFGRKQGSGKKFLMIGHLDTVFEADDAFQSFVRDGKCCARSRCRRYEIRQRRYRVCAESLARDRRTRRPGSGGGLHRG